MTDRPTDPRPLGAPVAFTPPPAPPADLALEGRFCRLRHLSPADARPLFDGYAADDAGWDYLPDGPYADYAPFAAWAEGAAASTDPHFLAVETAAGVVGACSFLRIDPASGSIEVGFIHFGPALQRTVAATEAMHLMADWAFGAGYRRYEWKCDALNGPSRRAAQRGGFLSRGCTGRRRW